MDARELGGIPYHPLPLALGVARYPPNPLLAGAGAAARCAEWRPRLRRRRPFPWRTRARRTSRRRPRRPQPPLELSLIVFQKIRQSITYSHATIEGADDDEDLVMIPMRDGTRLAMRLVTPEEGEGPWPALFQQRYGNDGSDPGGMEGMEELASHGGCIPPYGVTGAADHELPAAACIIGCIRLSLLPLFSALLPHTPAAAGNAHQCPEGNGACDFELCDACL